MFDKSTMISQDSALPGRSTPILPSEPHFVNQTDLQAPVAKGQERLVLGMGCFWGAERLFWQQEGVISTSVGYSGGYTPNPTYKEVCTGQTGHAEVVSILFDPEVVSAKALLQLFWENHDPTQGMRQGGDQGTQYRSIILTLNEEQTALANESKALYQQALNEKGNGNLITTEIEPLKDYYFAEDYHQQYLAKNPDGYCGLGGTGICFPPNR